MSVISLQNVKVVVTGLVCYALAGLIYEGHGFSSSGAVVQYYHNARIDDL